MPETFNDEQARVQAQRAKGYTDDEILAAMATHYGQQDRVKAARDQGHAARDIVDAMAARPPQSEGAAAAPETPSVRGFARNVAGSAAKFGGNLLSAVAHPVDTAQALVGLGLGAVEKLTPSSPNEPPRPHQRNVDAIVDLYKQRYGSPGQALRTAYEDPVGVLADASLAAGGAGIAAKGAGLAAKATGLTRAAAVAGTVAKGARTVAGTIDPMVLAGRAVGPVLRRTPLAGAAARLYESALKPPPSTSLGGKAERVVQTGLEEAIPVSKGGLQKLRDLVDDLNTKITNEIRAKSAGGLTVDPNVVARRTGDVAQKFRAQVNPEADLAAIEAAKEEFLRSRGARPATKTTPATSATPIPAEEAQALKVGTYRQLKAKSYGELKSATVEAQKALARGLKEELAASIPEIGALNARESKLLGLDDVLERSIVRIQNRELIGIGTPIAGVTGTVLTGSTSVGATMAAIRAILDNANFKSRLAIAIHYAQNHKPAMGFGKPSMATALSRAQEYIDSLGQGVPAPSMAMGDEPKVKVAGNSLAAAPPEQPGGRGTDTGRAAVTHRVGEKQQYHGHTYTFTGNEWARD